MSSKAKQAERFAIKSEAKQRAKPAKSNKSHENTKAENSLNAVAAGVQRSAFSISEFCASRNLSEGTYRKLRRLGQGPRETRVLTRVLIMAEDANAWDQRQREASLEPAQKKETARR